MTKPQGGSLVSLPTSKIVVACEDCLEAIDFDRQAEKLTNHGEIIERENRWRRMLNKCGLRLRMIEIDKIDSLDLGMEDWLKSDRHNYLHAGSEVIARRLLDAAKLSATPEMWVSTDDLAAIKNYWPMNHE